MVKLFLPQPSLSVCVSYMVGLYFKIVSNVHIPDLKKLHSCFNCPLSGLECLRNWAIISELSLSKDQSMGGYNLSHTLKLIIQINIETTQWCNINPK